MADMGVIGYPLKDLALILMIVCSAVMSCTPPTPVSPQYNPYAFIKAHEAGDDPKDYLYIGGLFSVHYSGDKPNTCGKVRTRGLHNLEAFLWAVRTYKARHPDSLEDINIGALALDSCSDAFHLKQLVANFEQCLVGYGSPVVDPDTLLAFVGPDRSGESMELASFIGTDGPPMISNAATSARLSDKHKYPYFLRTVPSDSVQVQALVQVLLTKKWRYVQLLSSENSYGQSGRDTFKRAAEAAGICVVSEFEIPEDFDGSKMESIIEGLTKEQYTRAVVVFATEDVSHAILTAARDKNARGRFMWLGTTAWANVPSVVQGVEEIAEGAITMSLKHVVDINDFEQYFQSQTLEQNVNNPWFKEYWMDLFKCYITEDDNPNQYTQMCDDISTSLMDTQLDVYVSYTIQAVDAILDGIDQVRKSVCRLSSYGLCSQLMDGKKWKTMYDSILKDNRIARFNITTGDPVDAAYHIYNYRTCSLSGGHCYEQVGEYNAGDNSLNLQATHHYDIVGERSYTATSDCSSTSCSICDGDVSATTVAAEEEKSVEDIADDAESVSVSMRSDSWVIPLIALAGVGVLLVIVFDVYLLSKIFGTPYIKHWRTMWLGQLLMLGILLCYLTLFAFIPTPTKASCGIIRFGVGVSYAMCFSVLLVKLLIVLSSESVGHLKGIFQFLMFLFAWGVQIVVDTEWLILRMPGTVSSEQDPDILQCTHGDFPSHVQSLVYIMVLIVICTILSIRTQKLVTNHRETVFIGICAGFTIPIWLVWILLGMFQDASYHDPCVAFGLFATATLLLLVMFMPKVRQLNSMGVEGIYAEDDGPDYSASVGHSPSVIATAGPPSVIGYAPSKAADGSVVLIPNGEVYAEPVEGKPMYTKNQAALLLKHPGSVRPYNIETVSVRSAPIAPNYVTLRRPYSRPPEDRDNLYATTRVLRMTNDLTGRPTIIPEIQPNPEFDFNAEYGQPRRPSGAMSDIHRPTHRIADLGAL